MANYYIGDSKLKEAIEQERKISTRHLKLTRADKAHLFSKLKIAFRETYANHFTIDDSDTSQIFFDGNPVKPTPTTDDLKDIFTEVLTRFENLLTWPPDVNESLMLRLHKMFYHEFKMSFDVNAPEGDLKYEGKPALPYYGKLDLNQFTNKVMGLFEQSIFGETDGPTSNLDPALRSMANK
jgi:hypothetical protein